ncbi:MAG TPA: membrane protein insertion efficiency factor YidD, partial [Woeseiaceae bacterium]|nr:membrane protein insertion efficiency factor YidD [Woeseiaceae bacterium]
MARGREQGKAAGMNEGPPGAVARIVGWPLLGAIWLYRHTVSPLLGVNCRFAPSCSEYASEALREYGGIRGGWLAVKRISRCHPWGGSG